MNNSFTKTILTATLVSLVCAIFISSAAVLLKPQQQANILLDKQKNILQAAGLYNPLISTEQQFKKVTANVVNLKTGKILNNVDPSTHNPLVAAKTVDPSVSSDISQLGIDDLAKIGRLENNTVIYFIKKNNKIETIILPIRGKGLWSTLYGFIALNADASTIAGIGFYKHGETPGLGGEIDNVTWKKSWVGKQLFKGNKYSFEILKGAIPQSSKNKVHQVDGLSGATLTTRGVHNLVEFWFGDLTFRPFLNRVSNGEY